MCDNSDVMMERIKHLIIQACDEIKDNVDYYIDCYNPTCGIKITIHIPQKYIIDNELSVEKFEFVPAKTPCHKMN